ncbi:MAG: molybdopterin cofactor-binding domain-containing protein [bacterium]
MRDFEYAAPKSVDEALALMERYGSKAIVMAGGTDVLVWMNKREISPEYVVHVGDLEELRYIREEDGYLRVGALATQAELASSELVLSRAAALAIAARSCAGPPVRNLATIGGNLGTATPAGDLILAVAALDGEIKVRGPRGARELTLDEFLVGPQQNSLAPDELIIEVVIPLPAAKCGSGFHKLGKRKAMTISTASAAASVVLSVDGKTFEKVNVVLGSLGATVIHSTSFEEALRGKPAVLGEIAKVCYLAGGDACPSPRARRASAWYRCEVAAVLAARAVEDALAAATGQDLSAVRAAKKKKGKGIAGCIYSSTVPGFPNPCAVNMQMREDGSVVVQTGLTEIGQGSTTVLTQMTAEALAVPYEQVTVYTADTGTTPYDFGTVSSRGTFVGGNAVLKAAAQVKDVLIEAAAAKLGVHVENLILETGHVRDKYDPERSMPIGEAARFAHFGLKKLPIGAAYYFPKSFAADEQGQGEPIAAFYYHATVAEVEVDTETGVAEVTKLYAAVDCGTAINPALVEGQVQGGAMQAVGWALREDGHPGLVDVNGPPENYNPDFMPVDLENYAIATAMDMPELYGTYVEVYEPEGPFGAKAAGEISANSGAPAVFNAIYNAVGVRLFDMPASPEKILWALQQKAQAGQASASL